jgi:hypothetical protein
MLEQRRAECSADAFCAVGVFRQWTAESILDYECHRDLYVLLTDLDDCQSNETHAKNCQQEKATVPAGWLRSGS